MSRINWANIKIEPDLRDALKLEFDNLYTENENLRRQIKSLTEREIDIPSVLEIDTLKVNDIIFTGSIKTPDFITGLDGVGIGIIYDPADQVWSIYSGNSYVRNSAKFKEIVTQSTTCINGELLITQSGKINFFYLP